MIIDLERFAATERTFWAELESYLDRLERDPASGIDLAGAERFYYLYQRACADLARLATLSGEPELRRYLESIVARAYTEMHDGRADASRAYFHPLRWLFGTFPQTFRRHIRAFWLAVLVTVVGMAFGCLGLAIDDEAKDVMLPSQFGHLAGRPSERVSREEKERGERLTGRKASFSGQLMTNNIGVSVRAMALGLTWGIGTLILLFYNGVILGAISFDYIRDGQGVFLLGWLLPHGSVEIPSIIIAGQAGLLLGGAIIGWGSRERLRERLRAIAPDLTTLIGGVAVMLVWAGIVEAFFSQYHEPVLPYALKITFGAAELVSLSAFLARAGRTGADAGLGDRPSGEPHRPDMSRRSEGVVLPHSQMHSE